MFKIVHAEFIAAGIKGFVTEAPRIARKQKAGQYVVLRLYEQGERIPLTIETSDPTRGNISIVVQAVGKTTHLLNSLQSGDNILDVVGPLGKPSETGLYRGRPRHPTDLTQRHLCRRRYCHWQRHSDPRHGRRPARSKVDPRVPHHRSLGGTVARILGRIPVSGCDSC